LSSDFHSNYNILLPFSTISIKRNLGREEAHSENTNMKGNRYKCGQNPNKIWKKDELFGNISTQEAEDK
jgi:hypothetical protein